MTKEKETKEKETKEVVTLHQQLAIIQQELKAPKEHRNEFGGFNYRSAEDILEAVKPLLNGLTLTLHDDIVLIGKRYYVKAIVTLSNGIDNISVSAFAREVKEKTKSDASQITGAASSYARKYALNGLFAIDDIKDPDTADNTKIGLSAKPVNKDLPKQTYQSKTHGKVEIEDIPSIQIKDDGFIKKPVKKIIDLEPF